MWAGVVTLKVGDRLVGVEYGAPEVEQAIRARCARWMADDDQVDSAAYGIRTAKVGLMRRKVVVLHHGMPVLRRFRSMDDAIDTLVQILEDVEQGDSDGCVRVSARAFAKDDCVVLVALPATATIDERGLADAGVVELTCWKPTVELKTGEVRLQGESWTLVGILIADRLFDDSSAIRRHAWQLAEPRAVEWAWLVDGLGDRVSTSVDEVEAAIVGALAARERGASR